MNHSPVAAPRKFNLLDAMILVAVVAGWLSLTRYFGARTNLVNIWYLGDNGWIRVLRNQTALLLMLLSLTVVAFRLRAPRPSRRRLWSQPGFTACVAAVVAQLAYALEVLAGRHVSLRNMVNWNRYAMMEFLWLEWPYVGAAVAGVWLSLAWSGRWRAEPSMVDRLGRVAGLCWLVEYFLAESEFGRWSFILVKLIQRGFK